METERLLLRNFLKSDLYDFYEYGKVFEVGYNAGWKPHKSILDTKRRIKHLIKDPNVFAIVYKQNNKMIGTITLRYNDGLELGYSLNRDYWGKGIIVEAATEIINYIFYFLKFDTIKASHMLDNDRSKRVLEKLNFKYILTDYDVGLDILNNSYSVKRYMLKEKEWRNRNGNEDEYEKNYE